MADKVKVKALRAFRFKEGEKATRTVKKGEAVDIDRVEAAALISAQKAVEVKEEKK